MPKIFRKTNLASVRAKVFVFYVASMLIIIAVMGYFSYDKSTEIIESKVGGMALQNVLQMSKRIDAILTGYEERSMLVFGNKDIQKQLAGNFRSELERIDNNSANTAFLANLVNARNDIANVYLLGERGESFRYSPGIPRRSIIRTPPISPIPPGTEGFATRAEAWCISASGLL